jgi:hypothetical protein
MLAGLPAGLAVTTLAHKLPVKLEVDHGLEVDVGSFFYNEPGLRNAQVEVWTSEDPPRLLGGGHVDQIGRSTMIMDDKPESVDVVIGESEWFDVEELQHQDEEDAT